MGNFAKDFAKKLGNKAFEDVALQTLREIFGEENTQILIFHMGGEAILNDPEMFEKKLRAIFKDGADLILSHIKYHASRGV